MEIGKMIKQFRQEKDMTQEQMAECLHVSVAAVSQWETGRTAPDLSMIPALCNLFRVSSDQLLGIHMDQNEREVEEIIREARSYWSRGYDSQARPILENGLKQFPNNYWIMSDLMYLVYRQTTLDEAIRLGQRILEGCTKDVLRHGAIQVLSLLLGVIRVPAVIQLAIQCIEAVIQRL